MKQTGGTPHAYIGKSWRLRGGMVAYATAGCKEIINSDGPNHKNLFMHAWMHVRVHMPMHVPRSGSCVKVLCLMLVISDNA
jgi:hypothetical protein